jgi:hypothetical protein
MTYFSQLLAVKMWNSYSEVKKNDPMKFAENNNILLLLLHIFVHMEVNFIAKKKRLKCCSSGQVQKTIFV